MIYLRISTVLIVTFILLQLTQPVAEHRILIIQHLKLTM